MADYEVILKQQHHAVYIGRVRVQAESPEDAQRQVEATLPPQDVLWETYADEWAAPFDWMEGSVIKVEKIAPTVSKTQSADIQ